MAQIFELGQIISRIDLDNYIKGLATIDEDMLNMYTGIFDKYICVKIKLSDLDYSRIDTEEENDLIEEYSENISTMPPIVTSPSFDGKRIVYDGCHRCVALEKKGILEVKAFIPYETIDERLVEDMEKHKPYIHRCKYGNCDKGKCCLCCEHSGNCGGVCSYCFELGKLYSIVGKNVSLFCNGIW